MSVWHLMSAKLLHDKTIFSLLFSRQPDYRNEFQTTLLMIKIRQLAAKTV